VLTVHLLLSSTGYGQHGDYVFGWQDQSLQKAMDASCFGATCSALKTQTFADANKCAVQNAVGEDVEGCKCFAPSFKVLVMCDTNNLRQPGLKVLPGMSM
jgi:hypothetical protein